MTVNEDKMLPQVKALKTTNLSPLIRMGGVMLPRILKAFLPTLDEKQRHAFDSVMPVGGEKQLYFQLVDTPTPSIVVGLAQPPKMTTMSEKEVAQQQMKGIRLTVDEVQLAAGGMSLGSILKLIWRLKVQLFTILSIMWMFKPFLRLGPAELRDLRDKATMHFKPLFDLLPGQKRKPY